ncbi:hypothetical protein FB381_0709 [Nocardioides albertanoniae]|uniref:Uncharacterized protein n=1 Tax=Nocardioides albertanoniae TaxID=1175486 RepID=A0A543A2N6_9ACTN|nr:hypothetical protein [Nocardioides albertanoniae]TQL66843.1 hypothetical protein FB381_0709 [Nocardioides albertanoniae]
MTWVVFGVAFTLVLALIIWASNTALRSSRKRGSTIGDGLGSFIDVFDPAQARAARDLKEQDNVGHVIPSPDGDDPPHGVDLNAGRVTIRKAE